MLRLCSVCLLCLGVPGAALRAQTSARPSGTRLLREVEDQLEKALSNFTTSSEEWDAVYLRSLLHLSKYMESASQAPKANRREKLDWPQIIHQTAKDLDHLNDVFEASRASWTSTFPSWSYRLWSDADMEAFMQTHYPFFMPTWQNYPKHIMRVDAVRFFWLHHFGGVYADMDFFALRDFSGLLAEHEDSEVILGRLGQGIDQFGRNETLPNALMISKPRAALWDHLISVLPEILHYYCFHGSRRGLFRESTKQLMTHPEIVQLEMSIKHQLDAFHQEFGLELGPWCDVVRPEPVTGPIFLSDNAKFHTRGVSVVEPSVFYPIDWSTGNGEAARQRMHEIGKTNSEDIRPALQREFPNALAATIWTHSWE